MWGGGGGRAWFSHKTLAFPIRIRSGWMLDRIPLKYPHRGWAKPASRERKARPRDGKVVRKTNAQPMGNLRHARVMLGHRSYPPPQPRAEKLESRGMLPLAVAHACTFGAKPKGKAKACATKLQTFLQVRPALRVCKSLMMQRNSIKSSPHANK